MGVTMGHRERMVPGGNAHDGAARGASKAPNQPASTSLCPAQASHLDLQPRQQGLALGRICLLRIQLGKQPVGLDEQMKELKVSRKRELAWLHG